MSTEDDTEPFWLSKTSDTSLKKAQHALSSEMYHCASEPLIVPLRLQVLDLAEDLIPQSCLI
jgi:hypothetical protein